MSFLPQSKSRLLLAAATAVGAGFLFLGSPQPPAVAYCDHNFGAQRLSGTLESTSESPACASPIPDPATSAGASPGVTGTNLATALAVALAANPAAAPSPSSLPGTTGSTIQNALRAAVVANSSLIWPDKGPITQPFGVPELGVGAPHTGIDIGIDAGTPVHAAMAGRVLFAGGDPCCGLGYYIEIDHGNHIETVYGHFMRPPLLLSGDYVKQGDIVGFSGTTGFSTGPHLHFELRVNGTPIDPLRVLPSR